MSRKFGTLDSLRKDSNDPEDPSNDDDDQQRFYVGGGERSGQQVLGGRDETKDIVSGFLRAVESLGARHVSPDEEAGSSAQDLSRSSVSGYRLGDSVQSSEPVSFRNGDVDDDDDDLEIDVQRVVLRMWKNGFTLNDGPLRAYDDPANAAFLNDIMHRVTPKELVQQYRGKEIDLQIERKNSAYEPPKGASPQLFAGQGQRLGEIEPVVQGSGKVGVKYNQENSQSNSSRNRISGEDTKRAQETVQMREGEPTTQLQLRFPDGQRAVGRFNLSHTLEDVRSFVVSLAPDLAFRPFNFMTTYPKKVVEPECATLSDSGLLNSVLLVNFV